MLRARFPAGQALWGAVALLLLIRSAAVGQTGFVAEEKHRRGASQHLLLYNAADQTVEYRLWSSGFRHRAKRYQIGPGKYQVLYRSGGDPDLVCGYGDPDVE